ncbi:LxmA leader domain family RiPP [Streptomyces sp. NPDC048566]
MTAQDLIDGYRTFVDAEELASSVVAEIPPTLTTWTVTITSSTF